MVIDKKILVDELPLTIVFSQYHILNHLEKAGIRKIKELKQDWGALEKILENRTHRNSSLGPYTLEFFKGFEFFLN